MGSFVPYKCDEWTIGSYGGVTELNDVIGTAAHNVYFPGIDIGDNISCSFANDNDKFAVQSIDVGMAVWKPISYPNPMADGMYPWDKGFDINSSESDGFAFELFNNMWDTNYPQWYPFHEIDANMTFNFVLFL